MDYLPIQEAAARQLIDSTTIFDACTRVRGDARHYGGGMYWKRQGGYEYLVKAAGRRQKVLGPRDTASEATFAQFSQRKAALQTRLASLEQELSRAERLNKAVRVGRVPSINGWAVRCRTVNRSSARETCARLPLSRPCSPRVSCATIGMTCSGQSCAAELNFPAPAAAVPWSTAHARTVWPPPVPPSWRPAAPPVLPQRRNRHP